MCGLEHLIFVFPNIALMYMSSEYETCPISLVANCTESWPWLVLRLLPKMFLAARYNGRTR